jgi:imidazolonepropionase-like amidohydrolase
MNSVFSKSPKLILSIFLLIIPFTLFSQVVKHKCIITNVNIVDVKSGNILPNRTVAIDSNRISAIYESEIACSGSTNVINGKGKYLIPGLWDMHAHYKWDRVEIDPLLIANGITGVREMWGDMPEFVKIPKKTQLEGMVSPDIYLSGDLLDGNPPSFPMGCLVVTTPNEAIDAVKKQIDKKVDFIKVYSSLSEECFLAIANETKRNNIKFAGHIPDKVSIYKAIDAGMASSEHLYGFLEGCFPKDYYENPPKSFKEFISRFPETKFDSLCSLLAKSSMWLCPTLTVNRAMSFLNDSIFISDNRIDYLPSSVIEIWNQKTKPYTKDQINTFANSRRERYLFELSLIGKMNEKGVKFLAGTDFPNPYVFPGFSLHDELSLMVKGGMSTYDALKTATLNAAIFINKEDDFGSVEVGKLASLVLLNMNPLENIENTKSIETVIVRGKVFNKKVLDSILVQAKANSK